jgi:predicted O-methyltransferase YrrM
LEVGAFEGRSAWLFASLAALRQPPAPIHLTSVDSWYGGDEHQQAEMPFQPIEDSYDRVVEEIKTLFESGAQFEKIKGLSTTGLASIRDRIGFYDVILIDAGHKAKDVLSDMIYAWPLLREGGVMILDDYTWVPRHGVSDFQLHAPKLGIDAFVNCFADELTILCNMPLLQLYLSKQPASGSHYNALFLDLPELPSVFRDAEIF